MVNVVINFSYVFANYKSDVRVCVCMRMQEWQTEHSVDDVQWSHLSVHC